MTFQDGMFSYILSEETVICPKDIRKQHFSFRKDWETSRWTKLLTLLMVLNSRASAVAGLLTSILVGILRITDILPDETWTVCFVHIAFLAWKKTQRIYLASFPFKLVIQDVCCKAVKPYRQPNGKSFWKKC